MNEDVEHFNQSLATFCVFLKQCSVFSQISFNKLYDQTGGHGFILIGPLLASANHSPNTEKYAARIERDKCLQCFNQMMGNAWDSQVGKLIEHRNRLPIESRCLFASGRLSRIVSLFLAFICPGRKVHLHAHMVDQLRKGLSTLYVLR